MNSLWIFFVQRVDGQKLWKREGETLCVHYTVPGVQWRAKWSRWTSTSDNNKSLYIPFLPYYLIILYILYMYIFFCIESRASARTNKENTQKKGELERLTKKKSHTVLNTSGIVWILNSFIVHLSYFLCAIRLSFSLFFFVCVSLWNLHTERCASRKMWQGTGKVLEHWRKLKQNGKEWKRL